MSDIDYEDVARIVAGCFAVADSVEMRGVAKGTMMPDGNMNTVRYNVFVNLIQSLVPRAYTTRVSREEPREPWQE